MDKKRILVVCIVICFLCSCGVKKNSASIQNDGEISADMEKKYVEVASGLKNTKYTITEFESTFEDNSTNCEYRLGEINVYITFSAEELESFLSEIAELEYLVFPGKTLSAYCDIIEDSYKERSGQDEIIRENIYKMYHDEKEVKKLELLGISDKKHSVSGALYYWKLDENTYKAYITYTEYNEDDYVSPTYDVEVHKEY